MKVKLQVIVILFAVFATNLASAQDEAVIPAEVLESWSALIGDWTVEGTIGSQSVTGSARFEWAEGRHCYFGKQTWEIDGDGRTIHLTQIAGWNPNKRETIEQGFSSIGGAATVRYKAPAKEREAIEGTVEGVSGADIRWSGTIKIERKGADEFGLTSIIDGDVVHSLKYVRKAAR